MSDTFADDFDPPGVEEKLHSRLGIASFVLGIIGNCLIWGAGMAVAATGIAITQGLEEEKLEPVAVACGFAILLGFLCNLVGLPLGIAGMFQKQRRLLYAIIGLGLCGLTVIGWPLLVLLTMAMTVPTQ